MVVAVVSPPLQTKKELARAGRQTPPGHGRLQLRYKTGLTGEEYVGTEAWRDATLERCPNHPHGASAVPKMGVDGRCEDVIFFDGVFFEPSLTSIFFAP